MAGPDRRPQAAGPPRLSPEAWLPGLLALALAVSGARVAHAAQFPVAVRDASGATVVIERRPGRIVSLAPSITEILFALGLDQEVVGVSDADDYPPARVRSRPRVGGVVISLERVVALRPDLVIGMPSLQRDQIERLRALRLQVLAVDARSVDETIAQVRLLGAVTGRIRDAETLALALQRRGRVPPPARRPTVYIEAWGEPILASGSDTLVDDLVRRAGGFNILSRQRGFVPVAPETVLVSNPQVILLTYPGRDRLLGRSGWRGIAAVRDGRVYELPTSLVSRPGPRIVEGLAVVARALRDGR